MYIIKLLCKPIKLLSKHTDLKSKLTLAYVRTRVPFTHLTYTRDNKTKLDYWYQAWLIRPSTDAETETVKCIAKLDDGKYVFTQN